MDDSGFQVQCKELSSSQEPYTAENGGEMGIGASGLPPLKEPCPQGSRCGTCRGCGFCEELRILLPELIFTFPCELRTSLGVPSNLDDGNTASL
ncbi:hypothetical protein Tco_1562514 [Tanacetum coccineum]